MRLKISLLIAALFSLLTGPHTMPANAQKVFQHPAASADRAFLRAFAGPSTGNRKGRENQLNWDPRFKALLRSSLRQSQSFLRDRNQFTPVPDLVHLFIEVPGDVLLAENRYVTINGGVPHDCGDRGMVWLDTAPAAETPIIFVATGPVSSGASARSILIHLRLFSSTAINWQQVPPQFIASFRDWWNLTTHVGDKYSPERVALISIIQPSGETVDVAPSIFLGPDEPPAQSEPCTNAIFNAGPLFGSNAGCS